MSQECDTLIRAGMLVTQNEQREIFEDAGIAIDNGRIRAVKPWREIKKAYRSKDTLDLGECLVCPGFINGHTHATMTIFRGLADDLPLMDWLTKHIFPVEKHLTSEIVYLGALLACAEMMRTGTTCFCDMYLLEKKVMEAIIQSGMKGVIAEGLFAFPSPAYATEEEAFKKVAELQELTAPEPRVKNSLMPHAVYTTTPELLQRSYEVACQYDTIWKLHLAETEQETAECVKTHGKRPVGLLHDLGVLSHRTVLAHGVDLNAEEIALLAQTKAKVVHNPESNMKLASGIAPVEDLITEGVCVALGTDGAASNNNLNMVEEMRSATFLQKISRSTPQALNAQTVLNMATTNGAQALGWPEIGSLEEGKAADLAAFSLKEPHMTPVFNPVSHLVYSATGHEIVLTMVDGKVLYDHGKYLTMDYQALWEEIGKIKEWVLKHRAKA